MTMAPIVATVAMLEPVTAPNAPHATTDVIAIPPGTFPIHVRTPSYRSDANPVRKTSCPIRTKSGMVTKTKLRPSDQGMSSVCAIAGPGPSSTHSPTAPVSAIANAMGTPSTNNSTIARMPIMPASVRLTARRCPFHPVGAPDIADRPRAPRGSKRYGPP